jgi:hypothetical protein
MTLVLYHDTRPQPIHSLTEAGLLTRLKSSILATPLARSMAEREAGSACSRGEEISSGRCVTWWNALAEHHRDIIPLSLKEKVNSHIVSHTPRPGDRASECSSCHGGLLHNTIRSQQCGADSARKRTARAAIACRCRAPHAASEPGQTTRGCCYGRILIKAKLWLVDCRSLDAPCRLPGPRNPLSRVGSFTIERSVKVTASWVLCSSHITKHSGALAAGGC